MSSMLIYSQAKLLKIIVLCKLWGTILGYNFGKLVIKTTT